MSAITFHTSTYEWAHGRQPRGKGYWAFFFRPDKARKPGDDVWFCPGLNTLAEAKRLARDEAKRRGATEVHVAS